jgi:hypothetical protein
LSCFFVGVALMKARLIVPFLLFLSLLLSCSTVSQNTPSIPATTPPQLRQLPERPEDTVAAINRRYNLVDNQCREIGTNEPRGHYYCSGVLTRGVEDGPFLPWTHSPSVIASGSSSYSWIRRDMPLARLMFKPAGFILRNPVEGAASGLPALDRGLICIYPFDASTGTNLRHKGCALRYENTVLYPQPEAHHRNQAYAWGQCEAMGIRTTQAWMAFWESDPTPNLGMRHQCSWNADSPEGWNSAISIFNDQRYQHGDAMFTWNELLLDTMKDDGNMLMPYIAAFYYVLDLSPTVLGGLEEARTFQTKLYKNGYWVPILQLNAGAPSLRRYTYHPEDQAIPVPGSLHRAVAQQTRGQ